MPYGVLVRFCIAVINTKSKNKSQSSQAHALTGGSRSLSSLHESTKCPQIYLWVTWWKHFSQFRVLFPNKSRFCHIVKNQHCCTISKALVIFPMFLLSCLYLVLYILYEPLVSWPGKELLERQLGAQQVPAVHTTCSFRLELSVTLPRAA